jgi:alpha-galactosidase
MNNPAFSSSDRVSQAMLTVFNWTNTARSHTLKLADLGLHADHRFRATDVLNQDESVAIEGGTVRIEKQPAQSVKVIKIIDSSVAAAAPTVTAQVPSTAAAGETINLSVQAEADGVPAVAYHWDFGDGTGADGPKTFHSYTRAADFAVRLTVDGVDGLTAQQAFSIKVTGNLKAIPSLTENRRFVEPTDR